MEIRSVEIKNYRSIKDLDLEFDKKCRILVGVNESGKSNILRALSFLDPSKKVESDDFRELLPDEEQKQEGFIEFTFDLLQDDKNAIFESSKSKLLSNFEIKILKKDKKKLVFEKLSWNANRRYTKYQFIQNL